MSRGDETYANPNLAVTSAKLLLSVQDEVFTRLGAQGFTELRPRHGSILGYLDPDGTRTTDLVRWSGMHRQRLAVALDELESAGYIERSVDPADRRAKLVIPTVRGIDAIWAGEAIISEIERGHAEALGAERFATFLATGREVASAQRKWRDRHVQRRHASIGTSRGPTGNKSVPQVVGLEGS